LSEGGTNPKVEIRDPKDKPDHGQFCISGFGFRVSGFAARELEKCSEPPFILALPRPLWLATASRRDKLFLKRDG